MLIGCLLPMPPVTFPFNQRRIRGGRTWCFGMYRLFPDGKSRLKSRRRAKRTAHQPLFLCALAQTHFRAVVIKINLAVTVLPPHILLHPEQQRVQIYWSKLGPNPTPCSQRRHKVAQFGERNIRPDPDVSEIKVSHWMANTHIEIQ